MNYGYIDLHLAISLNKLFKNGINNYITIMKNIKIASLLIVVLSLLNLVSAECADYTNNPYHNEYFTDEDGVEWVEY